MNFKEALIAHLQGEKVEVKFKDNDWMSFAQDFGHMTINAAANRNHNEGYQFRLAPRTITVNGVEVPAPESVAPEVGDRLWVADPCGDGDMCYRITWAGNDAHMSLLARGLLYIKDMDAIARAKAMLLHE